MVAKVIDATEFRVNSYVIIDGDSYQIKKADISKTGKHGHAKVRFEAINVISGKKKVQVVPGHDKFEVPLITKRNAQVLSVHGENVSVMDNENFENFELPIPEEFKDSISEGKEIEYWDMEGVHVIRKILN